MAKCKFTRQEMAFNRHREKRTEYILQAIIRRQDDVERWYYRYRNVLSDCFTVY